MTDDIKKIRKTQTTQKTKKTPKTQKIPKTQKPPKTTKASKTPKAPKSNEILHDFYILDDVVTFKLKGSTSAYGMVSMNKWIHVSKYNWYLGKMGYPICYELSQMSLHRFVYTYVLGSYPPKGMMVDHIDRNKLNNTDQNLRLATPQENSFNKTTKTNTKGVKKISEDNFSASITKDGKKNVINGFKTERDAAECYNMMAEELFGEFASKNTLD